MHGLDTSAGRIALKRKSGPVFVTECTTPLQLPVVPPIEAALSAELSAGRGALDGGLYSRQLGSFREPTEIPQVRVPTMISHESHGRNGTMRYTCYAC